MTLQRCHFCGELCESSAMARSSLNRYTKRCPCCAVKQANNFMIKKAVCCLSHDKCLLDHKCCICGDARPFQEEGTYEGYIDGEGYVKQMKRNQYYCSECKRESIYVTQCDDIVEIK